MNECISAEARTMYVAFEMTRFLSRLLLHRLLTYSLLRKSIITPDDVLLLNGHITSESASRFGGRQRRRSPTSTSSWTHPHHPYGRRMSAKATPSMGFRSFIFDPDIVVPSAL